LQSNPTAVDGSPELRTAGKSATTARMIPRPAVRHVVDGAVLLEYPGEPDARANRAAIAVAAALARQRPAGVLDAIPGARTLLVLFDPEALQHATMEDLLLRTEAVEESSEPRTVRILAQYGGEAGPDLESLARRAGLSSDELVRLHAAADHRVAFLGFAPGFPYMTGAPRALAVPRLATPRVRVPAGSVAVADGYTGIYPSESPGGWHLIGRIAQRLFEPSASPPSLLLPGDRVVFEPIDAARFDELNLAALPRGPSPRRGTAVLRIISPGAATTVQGGPRYGSGSLGVAAGGAMDLPALASANAQLGNPPLAAGLEITVTGPELEVLAPARIALSGDVERPAGAWPRSLENGDRLRLGRVRTGLRAYLCVGGGLAQPAIGAPAGPLRSGDLLTREADPPRVSGTPYATQPATRVASRTVANTNGPLELRAVPGPHLAYFSAAGIETFFSCEYVLSPRSDRRGLRLTGPRVELARPADLPPEGVAPGSVQIPGDGLPIVLGPDGPVTGGYPRVACVIGADLPLLAQARPGQKIKFARATLEEALAARRAG
jgi:KipI family sensor histidine kinase inhibitor